MGRRIVMTFDALARPAKAEVAGVDTEELHALNPGFKNSPGALPGGGLDGPGWRVSGVLVS